VGWGNAYRSPQNEVSNGEDAYGPIAQMCRQSRHTPFLVSVYVATPSANESNVPGIKLCTDNVKWVVEQLFVVCSDI